MTNFPITPEPELLIQGKVLQVNVNLSAEEVMRTDTDQIKELLMRDLADKLINEMRTQNLIQFVKTQDPQTFETSFRGRIVVLPPDLIKQVIRKTYL